MVSVFSWDKHNKFLSFAQSSLYLSANRLKGSNQTVVAGNIKLATEYRRAWFLATEHALKNTKFFPQEIGNLTFPSPKINIWLDSDGFFTVLISDALWGSLRSYYHLSSKALWRISHPSPNSFSEYVLICKIVFSKFVDKDNDIELKQHLCEKNKFCHTYFAPVLFDTGVPRRQCKRILQLILLFSVESENLSRY